MDEEMQLWQLLQHDAESSLAFEKSGQEEEEVEMTGMAAEQQVCAVCVCVSVCVCVCVCACMCMSVWTCDQVCL